MINRINGAQGRVLARSSTTALNRLIENQAPGARPPQGVRYSLGDMLDTCGKGIFSSRVRAASPSTPYRRGLQSVFLTPDVRES